MKYAVLELHGCGINICSVYNNFFEKKSLGIME